ncbi:ArsR/SmtB family transcription factor [Schleiferia thermophila]|jgi:DNA-binding transcriptional ArsR family regulator|uniref:ArsR family transcriptional regulator n=1 Tax=Schleiferia thermophila TaxID=884107 RepID=A0A368ZZF0_9FLAO|nr:metalloregulator ArsR/SmtB family transcription factor [Schleiferia thermophila]KFD39035.1 ArsR family transcriptional regulator [Schleiferia thermophila str. Yellowstone]PMB23069.1 transcriptional regulator [Fischerella thermalis CCMEE 5319]RCX02400.1 ArsR family transcriptional regulator [Schleiferia thermophila]GCD80716.1 transcriptional regulator [Schleiferia thermophila]
MGISKTDCFTDRQNALAQQFKALSHPARIAIVEHILRVNSCICSDLVEEIPLAQSTVSLHLRELKNAGIIKGSIEGNSLCYCLNEAVLNELREYISDILNKISGKTECC